MFVPADSYRAPLRYNVADQSCDGCVGESAGVARERSSTTQPIVSQDLNDVLP
jgi:hypothetical protein